MSTMSRGRRIAGWVLTTVVSLLFVASSYPKLTKADWMVEGMEKWGLGDQVLLIGAGELLGGLLFLIPLTHSLGLLLLTAYMGGAIATHMEHGERYIVQSGILLLIWLTGYLRYPEVLQSFRPATPDQSIVEY